MMNRNDLHRLADELSEGKLVISSVIYLTKRNWQKLVNALNWRVPRDFRIEN